jgi:hypothetical protein
LGLTLRFGAGFPIEPHGGAWFGQTGEVKVGAQHRRFAVAEGEP